MARQKVDAPATRIQRNLLSPVDTFYQSKTGVVVQPGEKSDGLRALEKSLNVAKRENDAREEKWNKEQQTLGTKAAMAAMAKDPRLSKMGADVHPSQSYQFQMAYDAKAGEVNAINFTTALKEEFDALDPTFDANGVPQPPDYLKFFQEKVGQKVGSLGDNQFFIGGFNKQLNQFLPQAYAEGAAKSRKIKTDAMVNVTGKLIDTTLRDTRLNSTQKVQEAFLHTQKMPGVGGAVMKETLLKNLMASAEAQNDPDILSELIRLADTGQLMIPNANGASFGLTPIERENIKKAATNISDEGFKSWNRKKQRLAYAKDQASIDFGNTLSKVGVTDDPAIVIREWRAKNIAGSGQHSDSDLMRRIEAWQDMKTKSDAREERSGPKRIEAYINIQREIERLKDSGITDPNMAAARAVQNVGQPQDLDRAVSMAVSVYKGEKSFTSAIAVNKAVPKVFGENAFGNPSGTGLVVKDRMNELTLQVQENKGKFDGIQYDINDTSSVAKLTQAIRAAALQQVMEEDEPLRLASLGPNARNANGELIVGNEMRLLPDGTPDRTSPWFQPTLKNGVPRSAVYEMLVRAKAVPEPTQPPQPPTRTPAATPAPTATPDPDARPVVGDYSRLVGDAPMKAAAEARDRRKIRAFDRTIRPEQIITEANTARSSLSSTSDAAQSRQRVTGITLDEAQIRAVADEILDLRDTQETQRSFNRRTREVTETPIPGTERSATDPERIKAVLRDFFELPQTMAGITGTDDLFEEISRQVMGYIAEVEESED